LNRKEIHLRALEFVYGENCEFNRYIIEWRHKILLRFFVTNAAFLVFAKWIYEAKEPLFKFVLFLPFLYAAFLSLAFYIMHKRNNTVKNSCQKIGQTLERELRNLTENENFSGFYLGFEPETNARVSFVKVLSIIYISSSVIFGLLSVFSIILVLQ